MVLSTKDILFSKDISEKKPACGYIMEIWIVSDLVEQKFWRCKIEF